MRMQDNHIEQIKQIATKSQWEIEEINDNLFTIKYTIDSDTVSIPIHKNLELYSIINLIYSIYDGEFNDKFNDCAEYLAKCIESYLYSEFDKSYVINDKLKRVLNEYENVIIDNPHLLEFIWDNPSVQYAEQIDSDVYYYEEGSDLYDKYYTKDGNALDKDDDFDRMVINGSLNKYEIICKNARVYYVYSTH